MKQSPPLQPTPNYPKKECPTYPENLSKIGSYIFRILLLTDTNHPTPHPPGKNRKILQWTFSHKCNAHCLFIAHWMCVNHIFNGRWTNRKFTSLANKGRENPSAGKPQAPVPLAKAWCIVRQITGWAMGLPAHFTNKVEMNALFNALGIHRMDISEHNLTT